jgi:hypothetical protein
VADFILLENGSYILLEDGFRIIIDIGSFPSPSPSEGYTGYTRGDEPSLPSNDIDLETNYDSQDLVDIATRNNIQVGQTATLGYMIHQFKSFVGSNTNCTIEWEGQSTLAPSTSTVYLQIYNRNTNTWDTLASDSTTTRDINFELSADINNLTNYKDSRNVISIRVYQYAVAND